MHREGTRRLAAVWFADIVGYSSLSAESAEGALAVVAALRHAADGVVPSHGGRVVKFVGDAALAVFDSVDAALRAALEVQAVFNLSAAARDAGSALRIGLHLGEVTEAPDGDVYGDGVNVAARLEPKARPGQVVVSRAVKDMVRGRGGYTVRRLPAWRHLKGLGLARVYAVVPADGAPSSPARRVSTRAMAVGVSTAILTFFTMMVVVAMESGKGRAPSRALAPEELKDGSVLLESGIDHYFAGELTGAIEALKPFARPPLREHPDAHQALRFLARAELQFGHLGRARGAVAQMFNAEPPLALLIPSAEDPALLAMYHDVRREDLAHRTPVRPVRPVGGVVVFDLEVVLPDGSDDVLETLGPSVAQMLTSELEEAGVSTRYFWALMAGFSGESAYARFRREEADSAQGRSTHVLLGRVAVRDGQVSLTAQVYDLDTGALVATDGVRGPWPDGLFDLVERLGGALGADLTPG